MIKPGLYKHYKGKLYLVIGVAKHSETLEDLVVYEAKYNSPEFGEHAIWVRPASMWSEKVEIDGKKVPRFSSIEWSEIE